MSNQIPPTPGELNPFQANLDAYRQSLIAAEQTMQSEYDKAVMLLSGGALGISMTLLKDIIGTKGLSHFGMILAAWIAFATSLLVILGSFYTSAKALRRTLDDTDLHMIYLTLAKSKWATATRVLNVLGGILFFVGLLLLLVFIAYNQPK